MSRRRDSRLPKELQLAAAAAIALALSLILPWYQKSYFQEGKVVQANVSAFGVFTFVEAAVLLVAAAVLFLVWARSQQKGFHLPGGDGVAITLAGGWAMLLLIWRLFDKPDIQGAGATMGIQWGIFGAMLAAGALIVAGARVRALHAPEPPNPAADDVDWVAAAARASASAAPERQPRDATAVTEMLRDRPSWEGDAREAPWTARASGADDAARRRSLARADGAAGRRADDAAAGRPVARGDLAAVRRSVARGHRPPTEAATRRRTRPDGTTAAGGRPPALGDDGR